MAVAVGGELVVFVECERLAALVTLLVVVLVPLVVLQLRLLGVFMLLLPKVHRMSLFLLWSLDLGDLETS